MNSEQLKKEVDEFNKEKQKIKQIVGQIGGKTANKNDKMINAALFTVIVGIFFMGSVFHTLSLEISLAVATLLIAVKVAWMVHEQQKSNHFQFWILNSLEFKINEIHKKVRKIEKKIKEMEKEA